MREWRTSRRTLRRLRTLICSWSSIRRLCSRWPPTAAASYTAATRQSRTLRGLGSWRWRCRVSRGSGRASGSGLCEPIPIPSLLRGLAVVSTGRRPVHYARAACGDIGRSPGPARALRLRQLARAGQHGSRPALRRTFVWLARAGSPSGGGAALSSPTSTTTWRCFPGPRPRQAARSALPSVHIGRLRGPTLDGLEGSDPQ